MQIIFNNFLSILSNLTLLSASADIIFPKRNIMFIIFQQILR